MIRSGPLALGILVSLATGVAGGSHAPPWGEAGVAPLPAWVRSARIEFADQTIRFAPSKAAARRGSAARDVRLPVFAARRGDGCKGRWLGVGPAAWVCEDFVELSGNPGVGAKGRVVREAEDGLPFRYFFVGQDGSLGYKRFEAVDLSEPDFEFLPGFAVAVVEERAFGRERFGRTNNQLWVPMRDLGPVHTFAFHGEVVPEGAREVPFAWVVVDRAHVLSRPSAAMVTSAIKTRFERVDVLEHKGGPFGTFVRIGDGAWLSTKDVRRPTVAAPPPDVDVASGERWIDVDLETQTLVAMEGDRPAFATIVSTGKGRPGSPTATPPGTFRIWVKLVASNMDNLEDEDASRYYRMEDVPFVQYFSKGVGLHGAFWHRSFGHVRSHGCVNLAPLDAQRLFWWTAPHLPAGWTAVLPTAHERGTVVRVR